jgi:DNA repair protein RadC
MIVSEFMESNITSSNEAYSLFNNILNKRDKLDQHREMFYCMGLNPQNKVLYIDLISIGTTHYAAPIIRECFTGAISYNATSLIVCHNHPSGNTKASSQDRIFTRKLVEAGEILEIKILDHIIACRDSYLSFKDLDYI